MPQDMVGVGVLSLWRGGMEFHTDDRTVANAEWYVVEYACRSAMESGLDREAVGIFYRCDLCSLSPNRDNVHTKVLENTSEHGGHFTLSDKDAHDIYQLIEDDRLLGIWHSHPSGRRTPSDRDWMGHPNGVPMYIVSIESPDELLVIRYKDEDRPGFQHFPDE